MTHDLTHIKWIKALFVINFIIAYCIAFALWVSGSDSLSIDASYYKYMGFIYLVKDRFFDLILILSSMASISAWRSIKHANAMFHSLKSWLRLVLEVIGISVIMINIIGIVTYFLHSDAFSTADISIILVVQLTYTIVGAVIGTLTGLALFTSNIIWLKSFGRVKT